MLHFVAPFVAPQTSISHQRARQCSTVAPCTRGKGIPYPPPLLNLDLRLASALSGRWAATESTCVWPCLVADSPPARTLSGQLAMRILIVEDEPDLLRALAQALRERGYAVDTATDGEDGLFKAETWEYDSVVLDIMLPKLDGWELVRRLRKTKNTPVLMLTARDQTRDRVRGLDTGADDYLVKPFDLAELLARLRALIRRTANQTRAAIEIGDVIINTAARNISRAGESVALTAREY